MLVISRKGSVRLVLPGVVVAVVADSLDLGRRLFGLCGNIIFFPRYGACRVKRSSQKQAIRQKPIPHSSPAPTIVSSGEHHKILEGRTNVKFLV